MKYATWNLIFTDELGTGPEETAFLDGVSLHAVWTNGNPENGSTILGKYEGTPSGLEQWNFTEISREEAELLVLSNHIDSAARPEIGLAAWTQESALSTLD
jgi:hypothetical protein